MIKKVRLSLYDRLHMEIFSLASTKIACQLDAALGSERKGGGVIHLLGGGWGSLQISHFFLCLSQSPRVSYIYCGISHFLLTLFHFLTKLGLNVEIHLGLFHV